MAEVMVHGEKLAEETPLPSVLEDDDAGTQSERLQLWEQRASWTEVGVRGLQDRRSSPDGNELDGGERECEEEEEEEDDEEEEQVISDEEYDTEIELEDKEEGYDPTGRRSYMEACKKLQVVPSSCFLRHLQDSELNMMHRGLGPKGTKALAVPLVTNTSILRLNLQDNWMEGMGGAAMAEMLKENCYITEVDLSDNRLGDYGARAIAAMLKENSSLLRINLSGNCLTDRSAEHLGPALISNTKLQHLDLSYNALGEHAGQILGDSLSENTGLRSFSLAWNSIRGRGAVLLANGLEMGRNPIQNAGSYAILKSVQENPDSAMETLDFSDMIVNQDFEDLYAAVKEIFPSLTVIHGGKFGTFRKAKA